MDAYSRLMNIFKKKTNFEKEQELEKEVIEYNSNIEEVIYGIVIKYDIINDTDIPSITKICNFHCNILPNINSIIWAPDKNKTQLLPYKVIRFDFIEDINDNNNLYIVVTDAILNDIVT